MRDRLIALYDQMKAEGPDWDAGEPIPTGDFIAAEASSEVREDRAAKFAVDGNPGTRWSSKHGIDPQWIQAELTQVRKLKSISIKWEDAAAHQYDVFVSLDGYDWITVASITDGRRGEMRTIPVDAIDAKFIKILGKRRLTQWGYSIWELAVSY